jgi:pyridoxal phosphate enzyme (YggS family)
MLNINNFKKISQSLSNRSVSLVAVSKTKPISDIKILYDEGQRIFGENKVQELVLKYQELPKDILWHLIGHLQSNKVKFIAPFITLIHSVDSLSLLKEIERQAQKNNRVIDCLLQFHIASEETKYGLDFSEAEELLKSEEYAEMKHVRIVGVMGMASFSEDEALVRAEFKNLKSIFLELKNHFFSQEDSFCNISMGMSGDYEIAIEEGSNMVRIGSLLFGER